jgi:hypothetical protein
MRAATLVKFEKAQEFIAAGMSAKSACRKAGLSAVSFYKYEKLYHTNNTNFVAPNAISGAAQESDSPWSVDAALIADLVTCNLRPESKRAILNKFIS